LTELDKSSSSEDGSVTISSFEYSTELLDRADEETSSGERERVMERNVGYDCLPLEPFSFSKGECEWV